MSEFEHIQENLLKFRDMRDWKQFHDPKNLAEAISIEAGELLEHFLWKTTEESKRLPQKDLRQISQEMADILIFLIYLGTELNIDLFSAVKRKIETNERKYPSQKSRGTSKKYSDL